MDTSQPLKPPRPNFLRKFISDNFVDLHGLSFILKILTTAGYLAVLGQLLFTLVIERLGFSLPVVAYSIVDKIYQVPLVVMAVTAIAFIMGWVFLLTGAAASRARVFLPVLTVFALQLFMVSSLLGIFVELLFIIAVLLIYLLTFRTNFWRDLPDLHFFGWLLAVSAIFILSVGTSATNAELASALSTNFSIVMLLTLAFWVLLGFSVFSLGIKVGKFVTSYARKALPFPALSALAVFLVIIHPMVALLVIWQGRDPFWSFDLPFSVLFLLVALVLWILRRWSPRVAAIFLALSVATPVIMVCLSGAFAGRSFTENVLKMTGFFPPILLFVLMTTYNLLGMGVTFTGVDGRVMPKRARILLYFGTLILVVACMLFISNEHIAGTDTLATDYQDLINSFISISAFIFIIPYGIWMIVKRRELLIGPELDPAAPPQWTFLEKVPRVAWIIISLVLACSCVCLLVGILTWLATR